MHLLGNYGKIACIGGFFMSTKTIELSKKEMEQLKERYPMAQVRKTPPYALYQIKLSDCVITAYESGKVVFQGDGAEYHCGSFEIIETKKKTKQSGSFRKELYPQCGSDEVGTGDYFGPVVVCATYVGKDDVAWLQNLGIQDSKAVDDQKIRELAPQLIERLPHSLLIMNNAKYNHIHETDNMVAIKCKLHNQAFVHLKKKVDVWPDFVIIDQFVQGKSYYRYLKEEPAVIREIHFETKAENKYLAVASGSIIARYAFLLAFDAMESRYDFKFLKGAGAKVDQNIKAFVQRFGRDELYQVAKLHFANTKKALGS